MRVLFVDDHPDVAESFATIFKLSGFTARALTDGSSTLKTVAEFRPQFVFLDLKMPGCDGADIARHLLALPDRPKVVVVSASGERQEEMRTIGVDGFLVKPALPGHLIALVRSEPPSVPVS
jgi:DNA-binding response OmpR family regulator